MSATDERRRRLGPVLLISLLVIAAILRAAALGMASGHLAEDRDDYLVVATQYAARGFWTPFERMPNSFRPPLYPLVIAAILKAGGGATALGLLQLALGLGTVGLTYRVGRKLDLGTMSALAAAMVAVDPLLIEYTTFPMTETLFTFLVMLLVAVVIPRNDEASKVRNGRSLLANVLKGAAAGGVFAMCALCRPTIWPVTGLAGLWLLVHLRRAPNRLRDLLLAAAAAAIAAAFVVSPWMLRNWKILGSPILTTTHGGYTLLLGNNEEYFHQVAARPLAAAWRDSQPDRFQQVWFRDLIAQMDREIGVAAGEVAQDQWMYGRARRAIAAEPRLFLRACLLRFGEFWNIVPLVPSRSAVSSVVVWCVGIGYAIEMLLFLAGLGSLFRRWDARWTLPLFLIFNFAAVHLCYWSNMRMRAPLVPLISLIAARAITEWFDRRNINIYVDSTARGQKT